MMTPSCRKPRKHRASQPAVRRWAPRPLMVALGALSLASHGAAQQPPASSLPPVSVTATLPDSLDAVPGSSSVVKRKQLDEERPYSIREALQAVPGLHVVGEDAFGLNLNIGIRGLDPRRSSRTLLLEDGMPIQLAPYSDPSAHYHTPQERLDRIEVIKGSGQIIHGPQTVGGVINFVTRPVPRRFSGYGDFSLGENSFSRFSGGVGSGGDWGGWLLEATQREGDGTRRHHEHRIRDFSAKVDLDLHPRHGLRVKLGHFEEDSKFGEAGLDQARFEADPYANPFRNDRFKLDRDVLQLIHTYQIDEQSRLSTQFFYQRTFRASYRQLDAIAEADGNEIENEELRTDNDDRRGTPVDAPACPGGIDYTVPNGFEDFAALCGNQMRPRTYKVMGIEPRVELSHAAFGLRNELVAGFRLMNEKVERKRYNGITPDAREGDFGSHLRDQLDIETDASSAYVQNTFHFGRFSLTPGLRYERYRQRSTQTVARRNAADNGRSISDTHSELLPGLGLTWQAWRHTALFAGVHRGIAPPRPDANLSPLDNNFVPVDPELSTNFELGLRSSALPGLQWEATLFRIDFKDQIVNGFAVGSTQTFANAGESTHQGVELAGRLDFGKLLKRADNVYLTASYTHLADAKFKSDLLVPEFAPGANQTNVFTNARGKRLPYAPRHLLSLGLGYERGALHARIGLTHVSEQFSDALNTVAADPNGQSGRIPSHTLINASVNYQLKPQGITLYLAAANLADREYLAGRVNGAQAGSPRQVMAGASFKF